MDGGVWWAIVYGVAELNTTERLHFPSCPFMCLNHCFQIFF